MESFDSSPNYMRATSSFDTKKENSPQGGSECDETISVSSSTCGSAINGPYAPKLNNNGIKYRTNKNKAVKNSFRRRAKSRMIQSPITISDDDSLVDSSESSPHYSKATSSSQGKKSGSSSNKSLETLSRTSSLRNVRILIKKTSFKPKRSLMNYSKVSEDVAVTRATYSSTLKDSKFPEPVELRPGGEESENNSTVKVCRYHHCSLHGHCHGTDNPVAQTKRFLYKKRRSLKKQKSVLPKSESRPVAVYSNDRKKNIQKSRIIPIVEQVNQDRIGDENGVDSYEETYPKQEFGDGYGGTQESDFYEVAFGEMSFPDRSYQENLDILRKYSLQEHEFGGTSVGPNGYCLRCSCHNREQVTSKVASLNLNGYNNEIPQNGFADVGESSLALFKKAPNEQVRTYIDDSATLSCANEESNKDCPETPVIFDEVNKKISELSSASYSRTSSDIISEEEGEFTSESKPSVGWNANKVAQVEDNEKKSPTHEGGKLQFSKQRHISMWHLIHQHMSSNLAAEQTNKPLEGTDGENGENSHLAKESTNSCRDLSDSDIGTVKDDSENQEIELRKLFAIKLVREAIEKILLPEVQDQTSDDQSVTSEGTPRTELLERNEIEACTQENYAESNADKGDGNVTSNPKEESLINDDASSPEKKKNEKDVRKSEKKAPKHWSNLKKWILLQRFIRELEKVRKFNPKKPHILPLNPDPEAEKVNLRRQTVDRKKNAEEWMLDYALRQAVGQLAPTQKRKVAMLVKAFETVAPNQEDPQVQFRVPRIKVEESVFEGHGKDKEEGRVTGKAAYFDGDFVQSSGNIKLENSDSENGERFSKNESLILDGNGKSASKNTLGPNFHPDADKILGLQEDVISDPIKEKMKDSGENNQMDKKNHIQMWHMIYQHVVSGIAEKVGSQLLDGAEDDEVDDNISPAINDDDSSEKNHVSSGFTKSDALKLVKEAVDEILLPEIQDDSSDTQSVTSESISDLDISERNCKNGVISTEQESQVGKKAEMLKSKNWSKLKKLLLLKRSINALEKARKLELKPRQLFPQTTDREQEKIDLRRQMLDERKKAEQWMLDYAVQHIVTKLTPARKRRVFMLVEAFEAVVPLPEM